MLKHHSLFGALAALALVGMSGSAYAAPARPLAEPPQRSKYPNAGKAVISPDALYAKSGTKRGKRAFRRKLPQLQKDLQALAQRNRQFDV